MPSSSASRRSAARPRRPALAHPSRDRARTRGDRHRRRYDPRPPARRRRRPRGRPGAPVPPPRPRPDVPPRRRGRGRRSARGIEGVLSVADTVGVRRDEAPSGSKGARSGRPPDVGSPARGEARPMPRYLLHHRRSRADRRGPRLPARPSPTPRGGRRDRLPRPRRHLAGAGPAGGAGGARALHAAHAEPPAVRVDAVLNVPTFSDADKIAALDASNRLDEVARPQVQHHRPPHLAAAADGSRAGHDDGGESDGST